MEAAKFGAICDPGSEVVRMRARAQRINDLVTGDLVEPSADH